MKRKLLLKKMEDGQVSQWKSKHAPLLSNYNEAFYKYADVIEEGYTSFGRKYVQEFTKITPSMLYKYVNISRLSKNRTRSIAPEIYLEFVGLKDSQIDKLIDSYLKNPVNTGQFRKQVREINVMFNKEPKIKLNNIPRLMLILKTKMSKLSDTEKQTYINLLGV